MSLAAWVAMVRAGLDHWQAFSLAKLVYHSLKPLAQCPASFAVIRSELDVTDKSCGHGDCCRTPQRFVRN